MSRLAGRISQDEGQGLGGLWPTGNSFRVLRDVHNNAASGSLPHSQTSHPASDGLAGTFSCPSVL